MLTRDDPKSDNREKADGDSASVPNRGSSFPATQWSMVLRARTNEDTEARAALETLCRRYWYPLYAFVRRQGRNHHEAEDCTQEFLARLLAADGLHRVRPELGHFRSFLLAGLRNFLTSDWRRTHAVKRGSGIIPVPIGSRSPDERFSEEPQDTGLTPEKEFDRSWALSLIDRAIEEVRVEYRQTGRGTVFDALARYIWDSASPETLARQAESLKMTLPTFTVALHRARRRLGDRLRAMVEETVANPAETNAELRHLVNAISGATPPR